MSKDESTVYPEELRAAEEVLIGKRRAAAGVGEKAPRIGLALSGGGIRSATVSLGVLQALAEAGKLKNIDFLSTVSGGGFIGSFLGRLYQSVAKDEQGKGYVAEKVSEQLADSRSDPVRFLRENGRYLTPNNGDHFTALALYIRNWVSLHIVLALVLVPLFLCFAWAMHQLEATDRYDSLWDFLASPIPMLALPIVGLGIGLGLSYWFLLPLLADGNQERLARTRRMVTYWSGICLRLLLFLAAIAAVDFLSAWLLVAVDEVKEKGLLAAFGAAAAGIAWLANWWRTRSVGTEGGATVPLPLSVLAGLGALLVWGAILVGYSALGHWLVAKAFGVPCYPQAAYPYAGHFKWAIAGILIVSLIALTILAVWQAYKNSKKLLFVNESGVGSLYFARLTRAYLGAANPERWKDDAPAISDPMHGDDVPMHDYTPHENGGPLHIVNMALNETVAGRSQLVERDRRGMNFAIGPAGVSVATGHHAKWTELPDRPERGLLSLEPGGGFRVWQAPKTCNCKEDICSCDQDPFPCERLSLGRWISVSGAAFSTGVGYRGSMALSLLCGAVNVRLGYWWHSGIDPSRRTVGSKATKSWRAKGALLLAKVLPVHRYLLAEFLARFPGTGVPYWHLSDGGHFENMGIYELLRRKLPLIIACDNGADPDYGFWDVGNFVRKARIDFGIRIDFQSSEWLRCNGFGPAFGELEDLRKGEDGYSKAHGAVGLITYADGSAGKLLLLKPTLTGKEPADVRQYLTENGDFPQQTTLDQFFTEAQWESYRKLGKHIAESTVVDYLNRQGRT